VSFVWLDQLPATVVPVKALTWIGLALQLGGTVMALRALLADARNAPEGHWTAWVRSLFQRTWSWVSPDRNVALAEHVGVVEGLQIEVAVTAEGRVDPGPDASPAELVAWLRRRVEKLEGLDQERAAKLVELEATITRQAEELVDARGEARAAVDGLTSLSTELAVASIPLQLVGLLLVAVGTVLATIPALCGS
jgi:hypothetical protein